eukprot:SAG11_NODE_594_length_8302_cov_1.386810_4_plen_101_part_00
MWRNSGTEVCLSCSITTPFPPRILHRGNNAATVSYTGATVSYIAVTMLQGSSGHAHASKNALNLRFNNTMLLVDSGRFQYNGAGLSELLNRLVAHHSFRA